KIKTYYVPPQEEGYRMGDITALNPEITSGSPVKYMDYSSTPLSRLYVVREDGVLAVCLTENGKSAWSRYSLGRGVIESVGVTPGEDGGDEVYIAAEIEGSRYLLILDESIHSDNFYSGKGDAYRSLVRSMPVIAGEPYEKKRITGITLRLKDSSLPDIITDGRREVITGIEEPYSGVVKRPAPSGWNRDVFF
ncbi:MAG: hypothetical protein LBP37_05050, partial [Spirochaetaceae bacterium]|nr:hypothetical protein [Spirochaetaceae bacterium]